MKTTSAILVHHSFDTVWPFAADHFHKLWKKEGEVFFQRITTESKVASELLSEPEKIHRLVALGVPVTEECLTKLVSLKELMVTDMEPELAEKFKKKNIRVIEQTSQGYWGQSVSEYGLALTLCALRRIPLHHHQIMSDLKPWNYDPPAGIGCPGTRGHQFGDDARFAHGTLEGKRVRIVGAGNIASRYASFAHFMGADVAAWDPYASEPCFHRSGARRELHLERLLHDAEIFAPMVPLNKSTAGLITQAHIEALPKGCLVVLITRAGICDMPALRRRVLADELSLAADVFDVEPLPLSDPLIGRHNVVHTPHNAGRTQQANESWAQHHAEQFLPVIQS